MNLPPIQESCTAKIALEDGSYPELKLTFQYDKSDPIAITLDIRGENDNRWRFSRALLIDGCQEASGLGDVRIQPEPSPNPLAGLNHLSNMLKNPADYVNTQQDPFAEKKTPLREIRIILESPDGRAHLLVPRWVIAKFLERTYHIAKPGEEGKLLDIDGALANLLS